jgi:hypothetical protein
MFFETEFLPQITSFLFVFAIVYGLVDRAKLFGGINTRISAIIGLVVAFFTATYSPFVSYMQGFMPLAAILLILLFFVVIVKKLIAGEPGAKSDALPAAVVLAVLLLVVGLLWDKLDISLPGITSENLLWAVGIFIIISIFMVVYKHPEK